MGTRFCAPVQTGPGAHPVSYTMGTQSFLGVKSGRGVTLTPHPLLVPCSRKGRTILLLPLWAVRPVQSLSACTRMNFTFNFYTYIYKYCLKHLGYGNVRCSAIPKANRVRKHNVSQWPLDHRVLSRSNTSAVLAVCLFAHVLCSCFVS